MKSEQCAAEVARRITRTEIAKVDESGQFSVADQKIAAVDVAVQPSRLSAKCGCPTRVVKVAEEPTVAVSLVVLNEGIGAAFERDAAKGIHRSVVRGDAMEITQGLAENSGRVDRGDGTRTKGNLTVNPRGDGPRVREEFVRTTSPHDGGGGEAQWCGGFRLPAVLVVDERHGARAPRESESMSTRAPNVIVKATSDQHQPLTGLSGHGQQGRSDGVSGLDISGGKLHVSILPARGRGEREVLALGKIDC